MRPASIRKFEILFLASLLVGLIGTVMTWNATVTQFQAAAGGVELNPAILVGILVVVYAINLLLWYLAAHRASNVAKWILVVFMLIGLIGLPAIFVGPMTVPEGIVLLSTVLQVIAVGFLFVAESKSWFSGNTADEPEVLQDTFE
ncbi:hypothetical protein [Parasphingorhabdus sp.]|uniref:hypothetical protein n=1 Tax=Parasphingorhabdus sp. TaxID=2709688 RepID=UPI003593DA27